MGDLSPERHGTRHRCEIEVAEGLEHVVQSELARRIKRDSIEDLVIFKGALRFDYTGDLSLLLSLKTAIAVYLLLHYNVPRPRALLGHQHYHRLLAAINMARSLASETTYQSLYLNAAGSGSSVMVRLKRELASDTGLYVADDEGDLLLRVRRAKPGWDVLVRLSPLPLATRDWRVRNMAGALNASVAHAMLLLHQPKSTDVFVNLACGSATLMIERLALGTAHAVIGCDIDPAALECAGANIAAAGYGAQTALLRADARRLPLADNFVDTVCADLPFGQLVGSHPDNQELYPHLLAEAARVARADACFLAITHEVRLMEGLLSESPVWHTQSTLKINLSGLHPRIYVLRKI
jgi:tRNA (guanine6-N2)-methyltransferase